MTEKTQYSKMAAKFLVFLIVLPYGIVSQKQEGDPCTHSYTNTVGHCTPLNKCESAQRDYHLNGIQPTFCEYTIDSALICCRDGSSILQTAKPVTQKPTEAPPYWGFAKEKSKRISELKCQEYSRDAVDVVDILPLLPEPETLEVVASAKCNYGGVELIVGGESASPGEFPHMAAIGWADGGTYSFYCGGTLISPRYVLTAAHCTRARNLQPDIVRLGDYNIDPKVEDNMKPVDVPIKKIIKHPSYLSNMTYHDIALLELATDVDFEPNIRPACLWTKPTFDGFEKALATGWGVVNTSTRATAKELQKVALTLYENDYCDERLFSNRNRKWNGFIPEQMCAGELGGRKDTCQGDSGGPLQIASKENQCVFNVIGVTSFGSGCAKSGIPAVYTRVSSYLDWIESIVWPSH